MKLPNFGLRIPAFYNVFHARPGQRVTVPVTVTNIGRHVLTVRAFVEKGSAPWLVHLSSALLRVAPGRTVLDNVTITVGRHAAGLQDVRIAFAAKTLSRSSGISVSGGVGSLVRFHLPPAPVVVPPATFPVVYVLLGLAAVAFTGLVVCAVRRFRGRSRSRLSWGPNISAASEAAEALWGIRVTAP